MQFNRVERELISELQVFSFLSRSRVRLYIIEGGIVWNCLEREREGEYS